MSEPTKQERLTMTIPQAAARLGIGRNQAYEAARRGEIPALRIGHRLLVPVAAFEHMITLRAKQHVVADEFIRRLREIK
jgi:excisionase family DNA binding protein